ncbi:hypothetical protein Tco_0629968 [Tanacetum coccineum]|uniref:Uncharacterized protein n=1 Tax=Tanacetum coccineum TaxID=301880 RepID=A0ABQ4WUM1_9ASTR
MGEPLSPDRVFDFPVDELEQHPAYDFFTPGPLPGYAGNSDNNNGWIKADVPLVGELRVVADEPMVIAPVVDMDKDIAMLFGDDEFEDDAFEGFDEEEVWEVNEEWLMSLVTPPPMLAVQPPSVYKVGGPSTASVEGPSFPLPAPGLPVPPSVIEDLSTRLGNLEYGHGQLVKKVIQVMTSQMVHAADRWEQVGAQVDCAVERHANSAAADYGLGDEQPGELTDVVHFWDGYATCNIREKTPRTSVVLNESSDEDSSTSDSEDEEYVMAVRNFKKYPQKTKTIRKTTMKKEDHSKEIPRSVLTDQEDQAKMEMETPRSSRVNSPPNAHS